MVSPSGGIICRIGLGNRKEMVVCVNRNWGRKVSTFYHTNFSRLYTRTEATYSLQLWV